MVEDYIQKKRKKSFSMKPKTIDSGKLRWIPGVYPNA